MGRVSRQRAFSLVEVLVTMAVLVVLAALVIRVGKHLVHQSQERLTQGELEILVAALEQYEQVRASWPATGVLDPGAPFAFGQAALEAALGGAAGPDVQDGYASSELLYWRLDEVPASRRLVEMIADTLKTSLDDQGRQRVFTFAATGQRVPLVRFVDAWGRSLRYVYDPATMSFPAVVSAGVDGVFGTADDLTSE